VYSKKVEKQLLIKHILVSKDPEEYVHQTNFPVFGVTCRFYLNTLIRVIQ
jgi:hypothetical protein